MGITPSQPAALPSEASGRAALSDESQHSRQIRELWQASNAQTYALTASEFETALLHAAQIQNYGHPAAIIPSSAQQTEFFANLKHLQLNDYVLAQACAQGHNQAWEHFFALYRQPLTRAAIAITNDQSLGQDLADALYAELYGLTTRPHDDASGAPVRKSPLASYKGRGSLIGWLRTTLAQRHIDHHRKTWREEPLDNSGTSENPDKPPSIDPIAPTPEAPPSANDLALIGKAVQQSLANRQPEDRFLLAAYFLDRQTLLQIARILGVHEATISRKLHRLVEELRKDLLTNLQSQGLSKRAAEEALGADPRDLDRLSSNLRNLLQISQSQPFPEKAGQ